MTIQLSLRLYKYSVDQRSLIIIIIWGLWHLFKVVRVYSTRLLSLKSRIVRQDSLFSGRCQLLLLYWWLFNIIFRFFFILLAVTHRKLETLAPSIRIVAAIFLTRFFFVYYHLLSCLQTCQLPLIIRLDNLRANWLDLPQEVLLFMLFFIRLL